ncbi:hypothetical protein [Magnetospirillum gryphiswaldense]|uniref:Uncharacterized protein n=1 Tax=Magnetospirillum gryphiswaldense TaxID=55518 RepID=A4U3L2_9PROT|nr:hypothetical protein [Magnetospirillum gryphiswaldense]AVM74813.1 hypothetical protein MSR1_23290 [Magnetospirillum gryphiswaldense MSR-1]AVM78716.1 hypothetical protein MSR1L_23290 [Magnetospirillum gryphiswaldense]CAM77469.1 hypothetical protein MGR_2899 [Magnetospirillum gryphiswaldense MSR-1]
MPVSASASLTASSVTYPVMVNGYMCYSAAEVAAVRRGQSPESVKPGAPNSQTDDTSAIQAQAKSLAEAQARIAQLAQSADALAQSLENGGRGTIVDIYA